MAQPHVFAVKLGEAAQAPFRRLQLANRFTQVPSRAYVATAVRIRGDSWDAPCLHSWHQTPTAACLCGASDHNVADMHEAHIVSTVLREVLDTACDGWAHANDMSGKLDRWCVQAGGHE